MRTVTEGSGLARAGDAARAFARVALRGASVTLVLLVISALPGPVPATTREAARSAHAEPPERVHYVRFQAGDVVAWGMLEGDRLLEVEGRPGRDAILTGRTYRLGTVRLLTVDDARVPVTHGAAR